MTIRHLRIFTTVGECGSITGAAETLYMTQPAVSLAIKEMETNYGVKLFDRMGRRIQITSDGERLLEYAVHIIALFDQMEQSMKNPDAIGTIKIGSSLTIGACLLPGYMERLTQKCPRMLPKICIENTDQVVQSLLKGTLDIGLVEGTVSDDSLVARAFMEDRLIAVCGQAHPFSDGKRVSLADFCRQPLLLRERGSGTREMFQSAAMLEGIEIEPTWESVSTTALIRAVEMGRGVSVLPEKLVHEALGSHAIKCVNLQSTILSRHFLLVYHKNKYLSAGINAFIDIVMGVDA